MQEEESKILSDDSVEQNLIQEEINKPRHSKTNSEMPEMTKEQFDKIRKMRRSTLDARLINHLVEENSPTIIDEIGISKIDEVEENKQTQESSVSSIAPIDEEEEESDNAFDNAFDIAAAYTTNRNFQRP